jgi:large conductance mechanosensitive channel
VKVLKEFKDFVTKGNLIDLAVAFIIAGAFAGVVAGMVNFLIMPLIAAIFGQTSFDTLSFTLHGAVIPYGSFLTVLVNFLLVAAAVFFVIVKPYNMWRARKAKAEEAAPPAAPAPAEEIVLLRQIRDQLTITNR